MPSEQPASTSPPEFRRYRRFLSWLVLGFVSLGSAYMLVSVGVTIYRRRNAVPLGEPDRPRGVARRAARAASRSCRTSRRRWSSTWKTSTTCSPTTTPPRPSAGRRAGRSGSGSGRPRASAAVSRERAHGPARQELGRAGRDSRRAQDTEATYTKELHQFAQKPGATPGPDARATRIGGPTHRHHHRRARFRSHTTMTDPFNDHTPDPAPPSDTPLAAADAAAVPMSRSPSRARQAPKGPTLRRAGAARRRPARRRRDGLLRTDAGAVGDLPADQRRGAT